jgi:hypothetical protein
LTNVPGYLAYSQPKSPEVWVALKRGFGAQEAKLGWDHGRPRELRPDGVAIIGGLGFDSPALLREAREQGRSYLFVDNGYFRTHERGQRVRYRIVPNSYSHHWLVDGRPGDRLEKLGEKVKPWRKDGWHVLVCTSSSTHTQFFGLEAWLSKTIETIRASTDRPIVLRNKNSPKPLDEDFRGAWAVVSWSSRVCVQAAMEGIPVFCGPESAALPIGSEDLTQIETPPRPGNRQEWANGLAYGQFTADEMASGFAREIIEGSKRLCIAS